MGQTNGPDAGTPPDTEAPLLSIGDLAEAAGIAPDTIRAWERRYGRPQAVRLPSGHRRYSDEDVRWLRRIAEALAHGHRPSKVVHLSERELDDLLAPRPGSEEDTAELQLLLDLLKSYRTEDLREALFRAATDLGPAAFLRQCVGPLLTSVGRSWADGVVSIRHEHMLSEVVEDVLRTLREGLDAPTGGPILVLATLPGEQHDLGLQMVALSCALAGVRAHLLGREVPLDEIARAADEGGGQAVALSVSLATGGVPTDRQISDLRRLLPDDVRLVVGGAGARGVRRGPRGVEYVADWDALDRWLDGFAGR